MKLLLDTHILLWAATGDTKLSTAAAQLIDDEANTLYFSAASIWELTIKGAERTGVNPALLRKELIDAGYLELPITSTHGLAVANLPNHHRDPFDRIMVAQALAEGITLVTHDSAMHAYPHTIIV
ncbi:type II toxin-antitoxin system VapC family toxin [Pseudomonas syringae]|uniref:type II toxin-antitoxin system VapC family toxin n=1 Tax=Pseudomonas syringae TaxID=317 RepID=UPI00215A8D85|nr:type II toxin-antitoxin system VapC family toxin [Pseudomonas syringae]MCR8717759.1 type II toxin-antitoxin system VapC family toxin [Pseudomonas syringae]